MGRVAPLALLLCMVFAAGCFETPQPVCAFLCGNGGDCPDGYDCAPDGFCKRADVNPNMACPGISIEIDASDVDAPLVDAEVPDADPTAPDADTTPDAAVPDAAVPDAAPDAAVPDAAVPDAA
jgi:hypothetical protein